MSTTHNPADVRAWARDNGMSVGKRGRLTAELITAYEKASGSASPSATTPASDAE